MIVTLQTERVRTLDQVRAFVEGSEAVDPRFHGGGLLRGPSGNRCTSSCAGRWCGWTTSGSASRTRGWSEHLSELAGESRSARRQRKEEVCAKGHEEWEAIMATINLHAEARQVRDEEVLMKEDLESTSQLLSRAGAKLAAAKEMMNSGVSEEPREYTKNAYAIEALIESSVVDYFSCWENKFEGVRARHKWSRSIWAKLKDREEVVRWKTVRNEMVAHRDRRSVVVYKKAAPGYNAQTMDEIPRGEARRMLKKYEGELEQLIGDALIMVGEEIEKWYAEQQEPRHGGKDLWAPSESQCNVPITESEEIQSIFRRRLMNQRRWNDEFEEHCWLVRVQAEQRAAAKGQEDTGGTSGG